MTILNFVERYKSATSDKAREQMLRDRIKTKYTPILQKRIVLQTMLDGAVIVDDNGIKFIDMVTSKINYTLALVILYTDLESDKEDDGSAKSFACYDALTESGVIRALCEEIDSYEIQELTEVNASLIRNFEKEQSSVPGYLNRIINQIIDVANPYMDVFLTQYESLESKIGDDNEGDIESS